MSQAPCSPLCSGLCFGASLDAIARLELKDRAHVASPMSECPRLTIAFARCGQKFGVCVAVGFTLSAKLLLIVAPIQLYSYTAIQRLSYTPSRGSSLAGSICEVRGVGVTRVVTEGNCDERPHAAVTLSCDERPHAAVTRGRRRRGRGRGRRRRGRRRRASGLRRPRRRRLVARP